MRWRAAMVAVTALAVNYAFGGQTLVRIELKEKASVTTPTIRLCDIAEVTPLTEDGEKLADALRDLKIAPSPLPRYQRIITSGDVTTKLAQAGWKSTCFNLEGAERVIVVRTGKNLTATELEAALQRSLNTPVKLLLPPPNIVVPEGELAVKTEKPSSPRALLPVTLLVNGQPVATIKLLVQVSSPMNTNATYLDNSLPSQPTRPPISSTAQILVRRRQIVRLVVRVSSVVVEAQGTALQEGKLGEEVLVAVAWSKTPLKGVVSSEREVTVTAW